MSRRVVTKKTYCLVFATLIALTLLTVGVAFVDLGRANVLAALTIAAVKSGLVVLFFMHVIHSSRLTWVFATGGFLWLVLLIALTLGDVLSRDWLPRPSGWETAPHDGRIEAGDRSSGPSDSFKPVCWIR